MFQSEGPEKSTSPLIPHEANRQLFSDVPRSNGLRFDVVRQVLTAIFRGQLKEGDRLVVQRLADEFKISGTPAREALLELAGVGAVEMLPNRGAVVRSFGPAQIREIYGLRSLLEVEAVRLACGRLPNTELQHLLSETQLLMANTDAPHSSANAVRCDRQLHKLIADHCNQSYLAYEIERIRKLIDIARGVVGDIPRLKNAALQEHFQLIQALLAADREAAMATMKLHIQSACDILIEEAFTMRYSEESTSTSA